LGWPFKNRGGSAQQRKGKRGRPSQRKTQKRKNANSRPNTPRIGLAVQQPFPQRERWKARVEQTLTVRVKIAFCPNKELDMGDSGFKHAAFDKHHGRKGRVINQRGGRKHMLLWSRGGADRRGDYRRPACTKNAQHQGRTVKGSVSSRERGERCFQRKMCS